MPPRGFNPVPLNDKTTSKAASIFDHLDGKQVWHITAPAGVSLKELKQLAMDKAMAGEAILNSNGADYGFSKPEKSEEGMREVLVPQRDGYRASMFRIGIFMSILLTFTSLSTNIAHSASTRSRASTRTKFQTSGSEHGLRSCGIDNKVYHSHTSTPSQRAQDALPPNRFWWRHCGYPR